MRISLQWISELVDISDIPLDKLLKDITLAGLEVADVIDQKKRYEHFIVGFVKEKKKHENADKLSVCIVDNGREEKTVICGAPNVEAGQKIILAEIGATIPDGGFKIKKAKIRGVASEGMICSEAELLLSNDHSGIKVLDESAETGKPVSEALGLDDVLIEIDLTPNRPDALSHIGVARDIAAIYDRELKLPEISYTASDKNIDAYADVKIFDEDLCPRYSALAVLGIEVKESPDWLKKRVTAAGFRPINNIVDVTNYVLAEFGQPLHAFDLDMLAERTVIVKRGTEGEKFVTLDSQERKLRSDTLMICDAEKPVAIGGVMGGENSEVTPKTVNVLIESAYFNPSSIRKTSKYFGLSTDASHRFERGTNPNGTLKAAERAAQLMNDVAGGEILAGAIDVYPKEIKPVEVEIRYARIKRILGYSIEKEKVKQIFNRLGFLTVDENDDKIILKIPAYRPDITREIDLIEEVARIHGYDNIPTVPKISNSLATRIIETEFAGRLRNGLTGMGFYEIMTNSLLPEKSAAITGNPIKMQNPQSIDMEYLRTSLIQGMLTAIQKNINVGEYNLKLFEIGNVFNAVNNELKSFDDIDEEQRLIIALSGNAEEKSWYGAEREYDFFDLKGILEEIIRKIILDNKINDYYYHKGDNIFEYSLTKKAGDSIIGTGGKVKSAVLKQFDIKQSVFLFELRVRELEALKKMERKMCELLRYPKVYRDFAFIFDKSIQYEDIKNFILKNGSHLLKQVDVFDIFEDPKYIGEHKRSLAISLEYFDEKRTLKEEEVEKDFSSLIRKIKKEFNAVLRGKKD